MLETLMQGLAANGPWALMAGFLLIRILKAWDGDRQQALKLMTEFHNSMEKQSEALYELTEAVRALRKAVDDGHHPAPQHLS
jgi:hypothetical protein